MSRSSLFVALLVLIVAGLFGWFLLTSDENNVAAGGPVELAEAWFAFFESGDVSGYQSLTASDAWWRCEGCAPQVQSGPYFGGRHGVDLTEARDSRLTYAAHGTISTACATEGTVVTCEVEQTDVFRQSAGFDPYRYDYLFTVEGGKIIELVFVSTPPNTRYQTGSQIASYSQWVQDNHPSDHDILFFNSTMLVEPSEKTDRHRQLISEWQTTN